MAEGPALVFALQYLPISKAVEELILVWEASEAEEWGVTIQALAL
jgi:hypothetical protein